MRRWITTRAILPSALLLTACSDPPVLTAYPVETLFGPPELDPTGYAPLTAEIPFFPDGDMTVTVAVVGLAPDEPALAAELVVDGACDEVRLPILGLYAGHANEVALTVRTADARELGTHRVTLTTGALPDDFPVVTAAGTHDPARLTYVEWLRAPMASPEGVGIMVDHRGRVRWYSAYPVPQMMPLELVDATIVGGDQQTLLLRYDLLGHELGRFELAPYGVERVHHDVAPTGHGTLLVTLDDVAGPFVEDRAVELDATSGELVASWDLSDAFPDVADLFHDIPMTSDLVPGITNDPVHNNALWHDERDDTLIATSQRSGVGKLDRSGRLRWLLAPHLVRTIDDADGDGVSDSLADGYDPTRMITWVGDYRGPAYVDERYPVHGRPSPDYPATGFHYGEFLLEPLDAAGASIDDAEVRLGFAPHPEFSWPFRPHAAELLPNGHLILFDNGLGRDFGLPISPDHYSRAVEYEIVEDETDGFGGTIRQIWEYRLPAEPSWHAMSVVVSDVDELPGGTRLVTSGALGSSFVLGNQLADYGDGPVGALVVEVDPARDNAIVHELRFERRVDDAHPAPEFSVYRAERVAPYGYWQGRRLGAP